MHAYPTHHSRCIRLFQALVSAREAVLEGEILELNKHLGFKKQLLGLCGFICDDLLQVCASSTLQLLCVSLVLSRTYSSTSGT
jgi:hypothetical protein